MRMLYQKLIEAKEYILFIGAAGKMHILPESKYKEELAKATTQEACRIRERVVALPEIRGQQGELAVSRAEVLAILSEAYGE